MDLSTVLGLVIGLVALLVGMTLKGVTPDALFNMAAILIIIGGTVAAVVIAFPMSELKEYLNFSRSFSLSKSLPLMRS